MIQLEGIEHSRVAESVRAKVRQGALATDATEAERITWLEQYVKQLDDDLDRMWETINRERDAAISEAERELREEHEAREAQRRDQLNRSMIRQAFGAICLFFGVVLTTIGAVA